MFKKLFISLLILSALTSEGLIGLPSSVYNLYMYSGSQLGLTDELRRPLDEQLKGTGEIDGLSYRRFSGASFVLSSRSFEVFRYSVMPYSFDFPHSFDLSFTGIEPEAYSFNRLDKDITAKSDTSPPNFIA